MKRQRFLFFASLRCSIFDFLVDALTAAGLAAHVDVGKGCDRVKCRREKRVKQVLHRLGEETTMSVSRLSIASAVLLTVFFVVGKFAEVVNCHVGTRLISRKAFIVDMDGERTKSPSKFVIFHSFARFFFLLIQFSHKLFPTQPIDLSSRKRELSSHHSSPMSPDEDD